METRRGNPIGSCGSVCSRTTGYFVESPVRPIISWTPLLKFRKTQTSDKTRESTGSVGVNLGDYTRDLETSRLRT